MGERFSSETERQMQKNGVELEELERGDAQGSSGEVGSGDHKDITLTTILVSNGDSRVQVVVSDGDQLSPKKPHLSRTPSSHDECRVCNADMEEDLIELGCHCRGWLAKAHRTCIDTWFRTRGSNKCEICKQVAATVPPPESLPSGNYPSFGRREGGFRPVCVALTILILGLLLDVLVSIVFGIMSVLGFGSALCIAGRFSQSSRSRNRYESWVPSRFVAKYVNNKIQKLSSTFCSS